MARLIVRPIDLNAPGSFRERQRIMRLIRDLAEPADYTAQIQAYAEAEQELLSRLSTDDGSPIEAALDAISSSDFDELFAQIIPGGDEGP